MAELTDIELWERAVAGDAAAFGLLFERHARAIYDYLFRRCADWSVAEDLTSVVFLDAYRRRATVRMEDEKVLPWLYGVATNVLRNQRRSLRRHAAALRRLPPPDAEPSFGADAARRRRLRYPVPPEGSMALTGNAADGFQGVLRRGFGVLITSPRRDAVVAAARLLTP